jgi:hypothetical protein
MCAPGGGSSSRSGLAEVLRFYERNRAVEDVQIRVTVGDQSFSGFMDQATINFDNPELQMGRFSLQARVLPLDEDG